MLYQKRSRTKLKDIVYAIHPYFNGLSYRNTSKALLRFFKKSHTAIRDHWIQKYKPKKLSYLIKKVEKHIIDETLIKVGSGYIWLWIAIDTETKNIWLL